MKTKKQTISKAWGSALIYMSTSPHSLLQPTPRDDAGYYGHNLYTPPSPEETSQACLRKRKLRLTCLFRSPSLPSSRAPEIWGFCETITHRAKTSPQHAKTCGKCPMRRVFSARGAGDTVGPTVEVAAPGRA